MVYANWEKSTKRLTKENKKKFELHSFYYQENFEESDPFLKWADNGKYHVNYKGLSTERSSSGKQSFKIDITFETATYLYYKIPVKIPSMGKLNFKGDIYISKASGAKATLGANVSLSPCPYSGLHTIKKINTDSNGWVTQKSDLVTQSEIVMRKHLLPKYCVSADSNDVGLWINNIGLFLYGKKGDRIIVYVDNINVVGNIPDINDYEMLKKNAWIDYKKRINSKTQALLDGLKKYEKNETEEVVRSIKKKGFPNTDEYNYLAELSEDTKYRSYNSEPEKDVTIYPWEPITDKKVLPETYPIHAYPGDTLTIKACRGEFEPASFILRAHINIPDISISLTDFTSITGKIIGGFNFDLRLVKCWYQSGKKIYKGNKILVPELLLKDDSLIKVDRETETNYMKVNIAGKDKYVNISNGSVDFVDEFILKDAATLRPFDLNKNENKQVWITAYIPKETVPGEYKGKIIIKRQNIPFISVKMIVTVLPFDLPEPLLEYSLYYRGKLKTKKQPSINSEWKTEKQYRVELENMKTHGVNNQTIYQTLGYKNRNLSLIQRELVIRDSVGFSKDKLYVVGMTAGSQKTSSDIKKMMRQGKQWINIAANNQYNEVYIYGIDEAKGDLLLSELPVWKKAKELGVKIFVACDFDAVEICGDILDLPVLGGGLFYSDIVEKWHKYGKKVLVYGNPQVGIENPLIYRSNYGYKLFCSGYDGVMDYAYQHAFGHIWNDFDSPRFRDHVFAYPTTDGVIDTIQWEGFREAVDDIRYLTALLEMCSNSEKEIIENWLYKSIEKFDKPGQIRNYIISKISDKKKY